MRYVDWVLPGILGMNMMFSSLFGVGYVVVRYRKNGFLKRLRATPLRSVEFVIAQDRVPTDADHDDYELRVSSAQPLSSWTSAWMAATCSCSSSRWSARFALISMGLLMASRVTSEELAGGLLNLVTWPMMLLSGVWFSLEAADDWVQQIAMIFPLTHVLNSARAVMLDGAGFAEIAPSMFALLAMSALFLAAGALMFRWRSS